MITLFGGGGQAVPPCTQFNSKELRTATVSFFKTNCLFNICFFMFSSCFFIFVLHSYFLASNNQIIIRNFHAKRFYFQKACIDHVLFISCFFFDFYKSSLGKSNSFLRRSTRQISGYSDDFAGLFIGRFSLFIQRFSPV